ncbi:MAG: GFA family protein [Hyphomicrobiales bacterium]
MNKLIERTGGCVCGKVRFETKTEPMRVTICHCTWCQRRTGSAFGTEVVYRDGDFDIIGDTLGAHKHNSDETGRWLISHFCTACGSNLGLELESAPGIRTLPAGTFDDASFLTKDAYQFVHVYTRSKQDWCEIPDGVTTHDKHFRK